MIRAGHWLITGFFALAALIEVVVAGSSIGFVLPNPGAQLDLSLLEQILLLASVLSLAVLYVVIAWGLYYWREWARRLAIVLAGVEFVLLVVYSFQESLGFFGLVAGGLLAVVLFWLLNPSVATAFAAGGARA